MLEGVIRDEGTLGHTVKVRAANDARPGTHLIALDITRDGVRHGELFDAVIGVG